MLTNKDAWLFESGTDDDFGDFVTASASTSITNNVSNNVHPSKAETAVNQLGDLFGSSMSFSHPSSVPKRKKSIAPAIVWSSSASSAPPTMTAASVKPLSQSSGAVADLLSLDIEPATSTHKSSQLADIFSDPIKVSTKSNESSSFAAFGQSSTLFASPLANTPFVSANSSPFSKTPVSALPFAATFPPSSFPSATILPFATSTSVPTVVRPSEPKLNITKTLVKHWCQLVKHVENAVDHAIKLTEQIKASPELIALEPGQKLALLQRNSNALKYLSGIARMQKVIIRLRTRIQNISSWPQSSLYDLWQSQLTALDEKCRAVEQVWQPVFGFSFQSSCISSLQPSSRVTQQSVCCICANTDPFLNEPHLVHFAGRVFHATCANLWLHAASMTLPQLLNEDDLDLE